MDQISPRFVKAYHRVLSLLRILVFAAFSLVRILRNLKSHFPPNRLSDAVLLQLHARMRSFYFVTFRDRVVELYEFIHRLGHAYGMSHRPFMSIAKTPEQLRFLRVRRNLMWTAVGVVVRSL